jgi:hypothetical protein
MTKREELDRALAAAADWRRDNVTGMRLPEEKREEIRRLDAEVTGLRVEIGRELVAGIRAKLGPVVLEQDGGNVTLRLPRAVLEQLLLFHEGGHSTEEHFGFVAMDDPVHGVHAQTLAAVLQIGEALGLSAS